MRGRLIFLGVIALLVPLVVAACSSDPDRDEETGAIVEEGDLSVFSVRVRDCFDRPDEGDTGVAELAARPCEELHDGEAFAVFDAPGDDDAPFPGVASLEAIVAEECIGSRFEQYVDSSYAESKYFATAITPTEDTWEDRDDREIICVLFDPTGPITGSVRGSGE
jgi:hypothetical protein